MGFALDTGYIPQTVEALMDIIMNEWNERNGTTYTTTSFIGTGIYKHFYGLIQRLQENEVKASEIFLRMQEYFATTNEEIQRPNTTAPGIYDYFLTNGYFVSVKPPEVADAGKLYICVDVDTADPDYATILKPEIANLVKVCCVGGVISQGAQSQSITLSNGQSFDFKFNVPDEIPVLLRLTTVLSENNENTILSPTAQKQLLFDNIAAKYRLGKNFEPQRYFTIVDAPWAESILLEWSSNAGGLWQSTVFEADYDEVFTFDLTDITLVES